MSLKEVNVPLAESIRTTISDDILSGLMPAGTRLDEVVLATRFNVSRTPVREALKHLISSGLVEHRHRCGVFVMNIPTEKLPKIFEYVAEMEALCARLAAKNMTENERNTLLLIHLESEKHVKSGNIDAYDRANIALHNALFKGCHNKYLEEATISARAKVAPYRRAQFNVIDRTESSYQEHTELINAVKGGDQHKAYEIMLFHIKQSFLASSDYIEK